MSDNNMEQQSHCDKLLSELDSLQASLQASLQDSIRRGRDADKKDVAIKPKKCAVDNHNNIKAGLPSMVTVWFLAVIAMGTLVVGQVNHSGNIPAVLGKVAIASSESKRPANGETIEELLNGYALQSPHFKEGTTIVDALRAVSLMYEKNIVPSMDVTGTISFTDLHDVTFEEALQAILGPNKYSIKENFIMVYTPEEYQADRSQMAHEVITLHYISATEAKSLITPVMSESGQVATTTAPEVDTEAGSGGNSLAIRDRIVVSDYPDKLKAIKETIASIDVQPPQILIEVTMLEAELDETTEFGIDLNTIDGVAVTKTSADGAMTGLFASGIAGVTGLTAGITQDHIKIFIRALESITDTTVLANSKILALNKQAGMILIGDRDGYITVSEIGAEGATQTVEFLESGTRLAFRPFICKDGLIRMELHPEQSEGSVEVDGAFVLPSESTTELTTNIMVKDGKTIVIGGLFKEKTVLTRSQVPLLGDLPLIGEAFRKTSDQSIRTELIILITPHIIHDPEDTDGAARLEDVKRIAHKTRKNITWLSRARIAEDRYAKAVEHYTAGDSNAALAELNWIRGTERTYLDAERLRERVIAESQPDNLSRIERIMLDRVGKEESEKWFRR